MASRRWVEVWTLKRGALPIPDPVDAATQLRIDIAAEMDELKVELTFPIQRDVFWEPMDA